MKRKYISDKIGYEFVDWDRKKVILNTQTGTGKTTFVVKQLLPYYKETGRKVLLLCNRTLLREQFFYDLVKSNDNIDDYSHVVLESYQGLYETFVSSREVGEYLRQFDVVIMDEFHFFISDAEFNGTTYILWKYLLMCFQEKTMILISATTNELQPLLDDLNTVQAAQWTKTKVVTYNMPTDYSYLQPCLVNSWEDVAFRIATSPEKAVVFIDDKSKASELAELLIKNGVKKTDIELLSSEVVHDKKQPSIVKELAMASKLPCKVLITTSVLDNGVSIKDNVGMLVIQTESPTSFIQMLGRVRMTNQGDDLKLVFVKQNPAYYEEKQKRYEKILKMSQDAIHSFNTDSGFVFKINHAMWKKPLPTDGDISATEIYRKIFTYTLCYTDIRLGYRYLPPCKSEGKLIENQFALYKIKQNYHNESKMHSLSREKDEAPALALLNHIGIDEIEILEDDFKTKEITSFKEEMLLISNFSHAEWSEKSGKLLKKYYKTLFSEDKERADRGFGNPQNANAILRKYGIEVNLSLDKESNQKRYTVTEIEE